MGEPEANKELLVALQEHHKSIRDHQKLCCIVTGLMVFFASGVVSSALNLASRWDFEKLIEASKCTCSPAKIEANTNHVNINSEKVWTREETVKEIANKLLSEQIKQKDVSK